MINLNRKYVFKRTALSEKTEVTTNEMEEIIDAKEEKQDRKKSISDIFYLSKSHMLFLHH